MKVDNNHALFLCPRYQRSGAYCFSPVCHSKILSETLTLLLTFEQWVPALMFHRIILNDKTFLLIPTLLPAVTWLEYCRNGVKPITINQSINPVNLTLEFNLFSENFILDKFFRTFELWYFTWEFLRTKPFCGYQHFWHSGLGVCLIF